MNLDRYRTQVGRLSHGKRLPSALYVHREGLAGLDGDLGALLDQIVTRLQVSAEFNVVKFRTDELKLSFLAYPDFESDPHPALRRALSVDLHTGTARASDYRDNLNPPILHRKEVLVPAGHPDRDIWSALTAAEEAAGLYANTTIIGFRLNWERLLASKGLRIVDHELVPIDSDWLDGTAIPSTGDAGERVAVDRHKTALRRYDLSKPVKLLLEHGLLRPGRTFFDYGCGLGSDVAGLTALGYMASGWDPTHAPTARKAPAQVVNLGYVLNVIEDPAERMEALHGAWALTEQILVVAALVTRTVDVEQARLLADGVLTSRNTFQKYYEQQELRQYVEDALDVTAVPLALGVFVVFQDPAMQQEFAARRSRRALDWDQLSARLGLGAPRPRKSRETAAEFADHRELLEAFWRTVLELARIPLPQEFDRHAELVEKVGGPKHALRVVLDQFGEGAYEAARAERRNDLLVYLALANLRKPVPARHLSVGLREDIDSFFDNYKTALAKGRELLFAAGDPGEIEVACEALGVGWQDEQALYFHHSLLPKLPPILRIYCGLAAQVTGDLGRVDVIKLHKASGKLTFLVYDDIENQHLPELRLRIKVNLRTGFVQVFDHASDHQVLCFKERYFGADDPRYPEWQEFSRQLTAAGVADHGFIGPSRTELDALLACSVRGGEEP